MKTERLILCLYYDSLSDLFIDEAAACCEAETAIPFHLRPDRLLMVGDPMQLPATLISTRAVKFGYDRSLLERLMSSEKNQNHVMLDVQYRMRPAISSYPSARFYDNKLRDGDKVVHRDYHNGISLDSKMLSCYTFLDIQGTEQRNFNGSYYNEAEAKAIAGIVEKIKCLSQDKDWCSSAKLRIITFYQGQTVCIRKFLKQSGHGQVMVATVDSSQGSEADIVIISFVRSGRSNKSNNSRAGFLKDNRRINVALTRAKFHLVCVGDATFLQSCGLPTLKAMVEDAKMRNVIRTNCTKSKTVTEARQESELKVKTMKSTKKTKLDPQPQPLFGCHESNTDPNSHMKTGVNGQENCIESAKIPCRQNMMFTGTVIPMYNEKNDNLPSKAVFTGTIKSKKVIENKEDLGQTQVDIQQNADRCLSRGRPSCLQNRIIGLVKPRKVDSQPNNVKDCHLSSKAESGTKISTRNSKQKGCTEPLQTVSLRNTSVHGISIAAIKSGDTSSREIGKGQCFVDFSGSFRGFRVARIAPRPV